MYYNLITPSSFAAVAWIRWWARKHGGLEKAQSDQRDAILLRGERIEEVAVIGTSALSFSLLNVLEFATR